MLKCGVTKPKYDLLIEQKTNKSASKRRRILHKIVSPFLPTSIVLVNEISETLQLKEIWMQFKTFLFSLLLNTTCV